MNNNPWTITILTCKIQISHLINNSQITTTQTCPLNILQMNILKISKILITIIPTSNKWSNSIKTIPLLKRFIFLILKKLWCWMDFSSNKRYLYSKQWVDAKQLTSTTFFRKKKERLRKKENHYGPPKRNPIVTPETI